MIARAYARALLQPCLTCGVADTAVAAAFQPDAEHAGRFGVPAEKTRFYFYALCEACYGSAGREEAAEAAILERLGR